MSGSPPKVDIRNSVLSGRLLYKLTMKAYKYLLETSVTSRVYLSILVGIFAKLLSVPIALVPYRIYWGSISTPANLLGQITISINQVVEILILAPLIENLIIPFVFWLSAFISQKSYLPILIITILAFYYHPAGNMRVTGATAFFCFATFYSQCIKVASWKQSYWMTVIAHFVCNLLAIIGMIFITPLLSS